jgi:hypothetical protein
MESPASWRGRFALVPAGLCAVGCVVLSRGGFPAFLFLIPLGIAAYRFNALTAWVCFGITAAANLVFTLAVTLTGKGSGGEILWDFFYFSVLTGVFTWIAAPPGGKGALSCIPGAARLIAGAAVCTLLLIGTMGRILDNPVFYSAVKQQIELVVSLYQPSGSDVVQKALLESLTPENILVVLKEIIFRGGGLASTVLIFWLGLQVSIVLSRLFGGFYRSRPLRSFHVHPRFVWVLSLSLLLVVVLRILRWTVPEIILWNILTLCAILYLAQGLGILRYFAARPGAPPFLRFLLPLLFIILIFSPGINAVLLGLVILLGIAENWAPFRAPKPDGPPSTPGE